MIITRITFFEIIDNNLWYELYISNGNNSSWPRDVNFDVFVQALIYKPGPTFRSSDNIPITITELETESFTNAPAESEQNNNVPTGSTSTRLPQRPQIANSYI